MAAQHPTDQVRPTPDELRARLLRVPVIALGGCFFGGLVGWLIDRAVTDSPYTGIRMGTFLGGLLGAVIASGAGWRGVLLALWMVGCMVAGALAVTAIWEPDPASFTMLIPVGIGVTVGMFVGLAVAVVLFRALFRRPARGPGG